MCQFIKVFTREQISNLETFQLEADVLGKWEIRTMQDKYFNIQAGGRLQGCDNGRSDGKPNCQIIP